MPAKTFNKQFKQVKKQFSGTTRKLKGLGRTAVAGMAGAALVLGNLKSAFSKKAKAFKKQRKQSGEVIVMKKSTVVALLVALAAVAGVLGALYFYVLRREKELDEYEQLLFSEDFDDDLLDDEDMEDAEAEPSEA